MIIHLTAGLLNQTMYKIGQYFSTFYEPFGGDINVKADLLSHTTKRDLRKTTGTDKYNPALKPKLVKLKAESDKIDTGKLKNIPVVLSKLKTVVNNHVK